MKYIILVLWTFSLFLLMFSSFPFRVECRPTRAMGPGPPKPAGSTGGLLLIPASPQAQLPSCPVLEGPSALRFNPWPDLYRPDITVKAWDTPLVLEGTARSRSEVRSDGTYGVTFDLHRVVKGDAPLLRRRKQFRLQFLDNPEELPRPNINNRNNRQLNGSTSSKQVPKLNSGVNSHSSSRNTPTSNFKSVHNSAGSSGGVSSFMSNSVNTGIITSRQLHQPENQIQLYRQQQQQQQQQLRNLQSNNNRQQQFQTRPLSHQQNTRSSSISSRIFPNSTLTSSRTSGGSRRSGRNVAVPQNSFNPRPNPNLRQCLPPKATVKTGRKYYVFAAKVDNHFIAVYSPELANKRNTKLVDGVLCKGCGQAPSVVAAKDVQLQVKERLRLRCRLRAGNPVPVLTWYKDGRPVNLTDTRFRLRPKRRQSILVIRRAKESDAGVYKCEAKNAYGSAHANVRVTIPLSSSPPSRPSLSIPSKPVSIKPSSSKPVGTTPTTLWPLESSPCPFDSYCLNGGTCSYYETIGEYVCQCAEGYKGQRCDTKDIPTSGSPGADYESARRLLLLWN